MGFPGDLQCDITHWKIVKESIILKNKTNSSEIHVTLFIDCYT